MPSGAGNEPTDAGVLSVAEPQVIEGGEAPAEAPAPPTDGSIVARSVLLYIALAGVLTFVVAASLVFLPYTHQHTRPTFFRRQPWFDGWFRWDAGWYKDIAERGYWEYSTDSQSPVAYFPAYPLLMRAGRVFFGNVVVAGIAVTLASGFAAVALFAAWLRSRVQSAAAWTAVLLLLLYPFAYYMYGAVYADALFVATMLGTFVLLERDQPVLAGLVAAVGTAARPVGAVVMIAFVIRVIERRGGVRNLRRRDAGILLGCLGVGAFAVYTWVRFGTPFAFVQAQMGWGQDPGTGVWVKTSFFRDLQMFSYTPRDFIAYLLHPITTLICLALVPMIVKRFGWGYGVYVALVVGLSAVSTKNFFGMGRYVLAAFPCFAAAGILLVNRKIARTVVLSCSGVLLVCFASYFARGFYLS